MATIASLLVVMGMDTKALTAGTAKAESSLAGLGVSAKTLGAVVPAAAAAAAIGLVKFGIDAVGAASDLEESINKVNVVFGSGAKQIEDWASTTSSSIGISEQAALEAAGTFGNLFDAMGLAQKAGTEMSTTLVDLAADLASFNNASPEDVLAAMQSGLTGQIRPLRQYGIEISDAALQQEALAQGITKSTSQMTMAEKVQLRYALILKQTGNAQGDFQRTSSGLANQQRILAATWEDVQATLGELLLPAVTGLVSALGDLGRVLLFVTGQTKKFDEATRNALVSFEGFELRIGDFFTRYAGYLPIVGDSVEAWSRVRDAQDAAAGGFEMTQYQLDLVSGAISSGDPGLIAYRDHWMEIADNFLGFTPRLDAVKGRIDVVTEAFERFFGVVPHVDKATHKVHRFAEMGKKALEDFRQALQESVQVSIGEFHKVGDAFELTSKQLAHQADVAVKVARQEHQDLKTIMGDKDLSEAAKQALASLPADQRHAWVEAGEKVRDQITKDAVTLQNLNGQKLGNVIDAAAKQASHGGQGVGRDLAIGVANGITAATPFITLAAHDAVVAAIREARQTADAASPSRKMALLGHDLMTGLANGISDAEEMALKAAQKAIEATIKEIEKRIDAVSSALDKIKSKASAFRDTISGGISGFGNLAGAFSSAQGEEGGMPLSAVIAAQVSQAQQMADVLEALKRQGASQALLSQAAGDIGFGQALLQGGPAQIEQANQALKDIAKFARDTGKGLTEDFFGKSIDKVTAKLDVLHEDLKAANQQDKVIVNIQGWVGNDQDIAKRVRDELVKLGKRNVTTGI